MSVLGVVDNDEARGLQLYESINWESFSSHFRAAMDENLHSVEKLAELWGCSPSIVTNLSLGREVSAAFYLRACEYANLTPSAFWQITL